MNKNFKIENTGNVIMRNWLLISVMVILMGSLVMVPVVNAKDWPCRLHDTYRAGIIEEEWTLSFNQSWVHSNHAPDPAWHETPYVDGSPRLGKSGRPRTQYDLCFDVAVVGGYLYYGSSRTGEVFCLDVSTGSIVWKFFTDGPVRLAPHIANGNVYVGSDDGYAYCLNATNGTLVWKESVAPTDRKLFGNGHLMSTCPVRSSLVVDGNDVFWAAGFLSSKEGMFICKRNALDGTGGWTTNAFRPHEGYLTLDDVVVIAPGGKGQSIPYWRDSGKKRKSLGADRDGGVYTTISPGHKYFFLGPTGRPNDMMKNYDINTIALDAKQLYTNFNFLVYDSDNRHFYTTLSDNRMNCTNKKIDHNNRSVIWSKTYAYPYSIIRVGNYLFAGGDGEVAALSITNGDRLWTTSVNGKVHGIAASSGRLFVSTGLGNIYCFSTPATNNTPPVANAQAVSTAEDVPLAITLTGTDPDPLTFTITKSPTNGSISGTPPDITYTPNADWNGGDSFQFIVSDPIDDSTPATVTITVTPVNDAPIAYERYYTGESFDISAVSGILTNDFDIDGDTLSAILVTDVSSNGTLVLNSDGSFTYTPDTDYTGIDVFTYKANDGNLDSNVERVVLIVHDHTAVWDELSYDDFEAGWGSFVSGGSNAILHTGTKAHQGTNCADIEDNNDVISSFYYSSDVDVTEYDQIKITFWMYAVAMENGKDFSVQYYDGSAWQTLSNYVSGQNFVNDKYYFNEINFYSIDYNLPDNMNIRFRCDAGGTSDDVYIDEITVTGFDLSSLSSNLPPIAVGDHYITDDVNDLNVAAPGVLDNDIDFDTLTATVVTNPDHGVLNLDSDGSFDYDSDPGYIGIDRFCYKANDGEFDSNIATVTLTIISNIEQIRMETGFASINGNWTTMTLENTYVSPVVVCALYYNNNTVPIVPRVRNAAGDTFEVMIQNPSGGAVVADTIYYMVVEEGTWWFPDGRHIEAVKILSDGVNHDGNWTTGQMEQYTYQQAYSTPVVLGQVMTYNDTDWSVFWAIGTSVTNPPDSSTCYVGKHVGEDSYTTRVNETLGVIIIEEGSGTISGIPYETGVGSKTVKGMDSLNPEPPYSYTLTNFSAVPGIGIIAQNTMNAGNGSWPYLYGASPLSSFSINLVVDEDQMDDIERKHAAERIAYLVFRSSIVSGGPYANDDNYQISQGDVLNVLAPGVLDNDMDPEGDSLTASVVSDVNNGTLNLNSDGSFDYTSNSNFSGIDSFTYKANDGQYDSIAEVVINVISTNVPKISISNINNNDIFGTCITPNIKVSNALTIWTNLNSIAYNGSELCDDGSYILQIIASNDVGIVTNITGFEIDQSSPDIDVTGISDNDCYPNRVRANFIVNDAHLRTNWATLNGADYLSGELIPEGNHTLKIYAEDDLNNNRTNTYSFCVDETYPVLKMIVNVSVPTSSKPAEGSFVNDYFFGMSEGSATKDTEGEVSKEIGTESMVIMELENGKSYTFGPGAEISIDIKDDNLVSAERKINGKDIGSSYVIKEAGEYRILAKGVDKAGNERIIQPKIEIVEEDTEAPGIVIRNISDLYYTGCMTVEIEISDENLDIDSVNIELSMNNRPYEPEIEMKEISEKVIYSIRIYESGYYLITVKASDKNGNKAQAGPNKFRVSIPFPAINISGVENEVCYTNDVKIDVEIDGCAVESSFVSLNDELVYNQIEVSEDNNYELKAGAVDRAGNEANEAVDFRIDKTVPVVEINGVENGKVYGIVEKIDVKVCDEILDMEKTSIQYDGSDYTAQLKESGTENNCHGLSITGITDTGMHGLEYDVYDCAGWNTKGIVEFGVFPVNFASNITFIASYDKGLDADYAVLDKKNYGSEKGLSDDGAVNGCAKIVEAEAEGIKSGLMYTNGNVVNSAKGTVSLYVKLDKKDIELNRKRYILTVRDSAEKDDNEALINILINEDDKGSDKIIFQLGTMSEEEKIMLNCNKWFRSGKWVNIIFNWDFAEGMMRCYINNEKVFDAAIKGSIKCSGKWIMFGMSGMNGENILNGSIDEVKVFDRALTGDECRELAIYKP